MTPVPCHLQVQLIYFDLHAFIHVSLTVPTQLEPINKQLFHNLMDLLSVPDPISDLHIYSCNNSTNFSVGR